MQVSPPPPVIVCELALYKALLDGMRRLRALEELGHALGIMHGPRTRGPKCKAQCYDKAKNQNGWQKVQQ